MDAAVVDAHDAAQKAPPLDSLVSQWLSEDNTLSRRQKQQLLAKEKEALYFCSRVLQPNCLRTGSGRTVAERMAALDRALDAAATAPDTAALCEAAERLSVSTDMDALYGIVEPRCILDLSFNGRTEHGAYTDADHVIDELCEQQESILGCRGDLAVRRSSNASLSALRRRSGSGGGSGSGGSTLVRAVSEVKSWVCQLPGGGAGGGPPAPPSPQVGTQITYYADTGKAVPVFSLHTVCTFTADGRKVEHISRTLLSHDAYNAEAIQREIHFGRNGAAAAATTDFRLSSQI